MPQIISDKIFSKNFEKSEEFKRLNELYPVEFNPENSLYESVFDRYREAYKDITGYDINMSQDRFVMNVDTKADKVAGDRINFIEDKIEEMMSTENPSYRQTVSDAGKESYKRMWSKEIYGLEKYMEKHLPPVDTDAYPRLKEELNYIMRDEYNNRIAPTIVFGGTGVASEYADPSMGAPLREAAAGMKHIFGGILQSQSDLIASLSIPKGAFEDEANYEQAAKNMAQRIWEEGEEMVAESQETLEYLPQKTGKFADPITGQGFKEVFNPKQMASRLAGSVGSNISGSILSHLGAAVMSASPWARGASTIGKVAYGLVGAVPGLTWGYMAEGSDMYLEITEELKNIRRKAKSAKINMDQDRFRNLYAVALSDRAMTTADMLSDENIHDVAKQTSASYAAWATGVELVTTGAQIVTLKTAARNISSAIDNKQIRKGLSKYLAKHLSPRILKTADVGTAIAKNAASETIEEGIQRSIAEYKIEQQVPGYRFNSENIWEEAYAGGVFGGGATVVSQANNIRKDINRRKEIARIDAEYQEAKEGLKNERRKLPDKERQTEYDSIIKGGIIIHGNLDRTMGELGLEEGTQEYELAKRRYLELIDEKERLKWMTDKKVSLLFKQYGKTISEYIDYSLEDLMLSRILTPEQIQEITGIKKGELKDYQQARAAKKKKVINADAERNLNNRDAEILDEAEELQELEEFQDEIEQYEDALSAYDMNNLEELLADAESLEEGINDPRYENSEEIKNRLGAINRQIIKIKNTSKKAPKKKENANAKFIKKLKNKINSKELIGIDRFNEEELELIKKLDDENISGKDLTQIKRLVEQKEREIGEEVFEAKGIKKGSNVVVKDEAFRDSDIAEAFKKRDGHVIYVRADGLVAVKFKGIDQPVNLNPDILTTGRASVTPRDGDKVQMKNGKEAVFADGVWKTETKSGMRKLPEKSQKELSTRFGKIAGQQEAQVQDKPKVEVPKQSVKKVEPKKNEIRAIQNKSQLIITPVLDIKEMEGMKMENLVKHAFNLGVKHPEKYKSKSKLISEILNAQPDVISMQGMLGVPFLNMGDKKRLFAFYSGVWYRKKMTDNLTDDQFHHWADKVEEGLSGYVLNQFREWRSNIPKDNWGAKKMSKLYQASGVPLATDHIEQVEQAAQVATEEILEGFPLDQDLGSSLYFDNPNLINSFVWDAVGFRIENKTLGRVSEIIAETESFQDFLVEASRIPDLIPVSGKHAGKQLIQIVEDDKSARNRLMMWYVKYHPKNNVETNVGDKEGVRKRINVFVREGKVTRVKYVNDQTTYYKNKSSTSASTMMIERYDIPDIVWLDGSEIWGPMPVTTRSGRLIFPTKQKGKQIDAEQIEDAVKSVFKSRKLVPMFVRGDSKRIGFIRVNNENQSNASRYEDYWLEEIQAGRIDPKTAEYYMGKDISDNDMVEMFGSKEYYLASNIAIHEAYLSIMGPDYSSIGMPVMMNRLKILFSDGPVSLDEGVKTSYTIDIKGDMENVNAGGRSKLVFRTIWNNGKSTDMDGIVNIDGEAHYIGDGITMMSQSVNQNDYVNDFGYNSNMRHEKTVHVQKDDTGVRLVKHEEKVPPLPSDAEKIEIYNGDKKVAEIRRQVVSGKKGVQIFGEGKPGVYNKLIHYLNTTEEVKVALGDHNKTDDYMDINNDDVAHILFANPSKKNPGFPMQWMNYQSDKGLFNILNNHILNDRNYGFSIQKKLDYLNRMSMVPEMVNDFILNMRSDDPSAIPHTIEEFAELGMGHHPTGSSYLSALAKNHLLNEALKVRMPGMDGRITPDISYGLNDSEVILPSDNKNVVDFISNELSRVTGKTPRIFQSSAEINAALKKYPIYTLVSRFPISSKYGSRILRVKMVEKNMPNQIMVSYNNVKKIYEGDFDGDTLYAIFMDEGMRKSVEGVQPKEISGISLDRYETDSDNYNYGSFKDLYNLIDNFNKGKDSIGQIVNVQRVIGIAQTNFNYMKINGEKIFLRPLDSMVEDKDMVLSDGGIEKLSLEDYYRTYAQAAFDNPKYQLLSKWGYTQEKLYRMAFYTENGNTVSDEQWAVLKKYVDILKKTSADTKGITLQDAMNESEQYYHFVKDREAKIVELADKRDGLEEVSLKSGETSLHPHELLKISPYISLAQKQKDNPHMTLDDYFNLPDAVSMSIHKNALTDIIGEREFETTQGKMNIPQRLAHLAASQNIAPEMIGEHLSENRSNYFKELESGEAWANRMTNQMYKLHESIELDKKNRESGYFADLSTWDRNEDFVQFYEDWYKGTDKNRGYEQLSPVERVAATYFFLGRMNVTTERNNITVTNVRKMPRVSKSGVTLLEPNIVEEYFSAYNKHYKSYIRGDFEQSGAKLSVKPLSKEVKEYYCG